VKIKIRKKDIIAESKGNNFEHSHTSNGLEDSLVARGCEYLLPYLPSNDARKELDVYECFYSCRQCWASKCRGL
jgi:hypothetical protein